MVEEDYRHKSLLHFPFIISVWHTLYVYIYVKNLYFCVRFMLCRYEKVHMSSWQGGLGLHRPAYFPCTPIKHRPHSVEHIFQLLCSGGTFYWKSPELDWKVNIEPTETSKMCDGCLRQLTSWNKLQIHLPTQFSSPGNWRIRTFRERKEYWRVHLSVAFAWSCLGAAQG